MGRFASAKAKIDNMGIIRKALNYLIDLLDQGYSIESTIGGKKIVITINAIIGIEITVDGVKQFGVDTTGAIYVSRISTTGSTNAYGIVGDYPGVGIGYALYDTNVQSNPMFHITYYGTISTNDLGVAIFDSDNIARVFFTDTIPFNIVDSLGEDRLYILQDGSIHARNIGSTKSVIEYNGTSKETIIRYGGATDHALGVDVTGPYKIISGVKTYL